MKFWKVLTLVLVVIGLAAVATAGFTSWTAPAVLTSVLLIGAPLVAALVLVAYFEWRERLTRRAVAEDAHDDETLHAA